MNTEHLIEELKKDIIYFSNIDCPVLASKFQRDLDLILQLTSTSNNDMSKGESYDK